MIIFQPGGSNLRHAFFPIALRASDAWIPNVLVIEAEVAYLALEDGISSCLLACLPSPSHERLGCKAVVCFWSMRGPSRISAISLNSSAE